MPEFVNPVDSNRVFYRITLLFNGLHDFLKVTNQMCGPTNCQVLKQNFVHKLKINAGAAVFNNPFFALLSSLAGRLPLRAADAMNGLHHGLHGLWRRELRNAMTEVEYMAMT